ncbi:LIC_10190 family membrane protein [Flavobacterium subsaxonicum]|uniref:DUF8201 domain-containing protein n=1 Tax=Flavobacterium subsaxonicum WB 4.1-42 = DSM 21790 TaxID=1121898 RepID=A0A0A2MI72_9FLAO|nr:hypothetical protein [Flavobacterium subsaxonicum]KGO92009.1 hypothetical protein Q766_15320 [Flavobacterium subsaxonicum WB 4.1-42 = DSM 21790]
MIVIAVYWLFLFILLLPLGILAKHVLQLPTQNAVITLLLGIVLLTCGFTLTAFFFKLGAVNLVCWSALSLASGIYFKGEVKQLLTNFGTSLKRLPTYSKTAIAILTVGALFKSAQYPFITDNESYYIQTIKWLNQYGFVKGLANLHVFFAQNSAWHILQAGVNFSFVTNRINDINGFVFLICTVFCVSESEILTQKTRYWLGFVPVFSLLLFLFLDVPSPDLPLLVIVPIIVHLFVTEDSNNSNFKIALLLFIFLVSIKLTILPLGILFVPGLFRKGNIKFALLTGIPIATLWIAKNTIISGYPLYPIAYFKTDFDWAIPNNLFNAIISGTADYGYYRDGSLPAGISMTGKLLLWLQQRDLARIVNIATLLVLGILPFTGILKNKKYRLVYVALLVNFIAVLLTSPQFRYFIYITLCGSLLVIAAVYNYFRAKPVYFKFLAIAGTLAAFVSFVNVGLSDLTRNKLHQEVAQPAVSQIYLPERTTKLPNLNYLKKTTGNLDYYSPEYNFFRYGTADGPLPCVNTNQLEYFEKKLGILPQLRGETLTEGFYSAKIK